MADLSFWSCGGRLRYQISRGYEKGVDDIPVKRADEEGENVAGVVPAFFLLIFGCHYPKCDESRTDGFFPFNANDYGAIKSLTVT